MLKMKVRKEKKGSEELPQGYGGGGGGADGPARGSWGNVMSGYNRAICSKLIPKNSNLNKYYNCNLIVRTPDMHE